MPHQNLTVAALNNMTTLPTSHHTNHLSLSLWHYFSYLLIFHPSIVRRCPQPACYPPTYQSSLSFAYFPSLLIFVPLTTLTLIYTFNLFINHCHSYFHTTPSSLHYWKVTVLKGTHNFTRQFFFVYYYCNLMFRYSLLSLLSSPP